MSYNLYPVWMTVVSQSVDCPNFRKTKWQLTVLELPHILGWLMRLLSLR